MDQEQLANIKSNLYAADVFHRRAMAIVDDRLARHEPLTPMERQDITHNLDCAESHRRSAIESLT